MRVHSAATLCTGSNNVLDSASAAAVFPALAAVTSLTSLNIRCTVPRAREWAGAVWGERELAGADSMVERGGAAAVQHLNPSGFVG